MAPRETKAVPLRATHDRSVFRSGNNQVDDFFANSLDFHESYDGRIHVLEGAGDGEILGYYCLRFISFGSKKNKSVDLQLHMLGVQKASQGQGHGTRHGCFRKGSTNR